MKPHAELDVLYGCVGNAGGIAALVESSKLEEDVAPDGAESSPERGRVARALVVDVVVEQVAEVRDDASRAGIVIVGAEQSSQVSVTIEGGPDPDEDVLMHLNVGIHKHEHIASGLSGPEVSRRGRAETLRPIDDDQLLRSRQGPPNCADGAVERDSSIGGRNHDTELDHRASLGRQLAHCPPSPAYSTR